MVLVVRQADRAHEGEWRKGERNVDCLIPLPSSSEEIVAATLAVNRVFSARAHQARISGVVSMGDYLVTGSMDRLVRVWRMVRVGWRM